MLLEDDTNNRDKIYEFTLRIESADDPAIETHQDFWITDHMPQVKTIVDDTQLWTKDAAGINITISKDMPAAYKDCIKVPGPVCSNPTHSRHTNVLLYI